MHYILHHTLSRDTIMGMKSYTMHITQYTVNIIPNTPHLLPPLFSVQFPVVVRVYIAIWGTCVLLMGTEQISEESADSAADGSETEREGPCSRTSQAAPGLPVQDTVFLDSPSYIKSVVWEEGKEIPLLHADQERKFRSFRSPPFSPLGCHLAGGQHCVATSHHLAGERDTKEDRVDRRPSLGSIEGRHDSSWPIHHDRFQTHDSYFIGRSGPS